MITNKLNTQWLGREFLEFDSLPCTNDYCKEQMERLSHGAVVSALRQTSGKGTKGRAWKGTPGMGIALSFVLKGVRLADLTVLPLLCGLAETLALGQFGVSAGIKWPNDIVLGGKKLSGILCESVIMSGSVDVVCGIGINLLQDSSYFAERELPYGGSVFSETGKRISREEVMAALLNQFEQLFERYQADGFAALKGRYEEKCVTLHRQVRVIAGGTECEALALGVADDGRLLCEIAGEKRLIDHGEASVRGLWGYA